MNNPEETVTLWQLIAAWAKHLARRAWMYAAWPFRYTRITAINAWKTWNIRRQKIEINAACPACGHRSGDIMWSQEYKRVMHFCKVCKAAWGEDPVVKADDWMIKAKTIENFVDAFLTGKPPVGLSSQHKGEAKTQ